MKKIKLLLLVVFLLGSLVACGSTESNSNKNKDKSELKKVVIGYFPNIDHVPAMVARENGYFQEELGSDVEIEYLTFPDGGTFMTALKSGEIDAGLVGPGPVMNNYVNGADVSIVSGASSGGTVVVAGANSGIESLADIEGKTFITPGIGCTHNVQFEAYLQEQANKNLTSSRIGGSLRHVTGNPAQYSGMLETGKVDLAAVPEPWASILINEGAKEIVSTSDIAYGETLPNTVFVANGKLIKNSSNTVQALVNAQKRAIEFINDNADLSVDIAINSINELTKQTLDKDVVTQAMKKINYTIDVNEDVVKEFAHSSFELQFLKEKPQLDGLINLTYLNN